MSTTRIPVRVGQVWKDTDPRIKARELVVEQIDQTHATMRVVGTNRRPRIRLDRFRPNSTGYKCVRDVAGRSEDCETLSIGGAIQKANGQNFTVKEAGEFEAAFLQWLEKRGLGFGGSIKGQN
jgi:hypothetical protein